MAPRGRDASKVANLLAFLGSKKNAFNLQSTSNYHELLFCCDRFRDVFKLPDFGARDFDSALELESQNYRAGLKGIYQSNLIQKLFIALGKPFAKGSFNDSNYNEVLHNVFERKLVKDGAPNPLGELSTANVHSLPNEVKLYLLHFLMDLRMRKDESETVDNFCDASALRVLRLGEDTLHNVYYYFGDFRLVVELKEKQIYQHNIEENQRIASPWCQFYDICTSEAQFVCLAETREQWKVLWEFLEKFANSTNEKKIGLAIRQLFNNEHKLFVSELNRRAKLKSDESRLLAKLEMEARKELGIVRSSGRIQAKDKERRQREEQERKEREKEEEELRQKLFAEGNGRVPRMSLSTQKQLTREERRLQREALLAQMESKQEKTMEYDHITDSTQKVKPSRDGGSSRGSIVSDSVTSDNSLASESKCSESSDVRSVPSCGVKRAVDSSASDFSNGNGGHSKKICLGSSEQVVEPYSHGSSSYSIEHHYEQLCRPFEERSSQSYQQSLAVAERFILKEVNIIGGPSIIVPANGPPDSIPSSKQFCEHHFKMCNPANRLVNSRLNLVLLLDNVVVSAELQREKDWAKKVVRMMRRCWDLLFSVSDQSREDNAAKIIMDKLLILVS